MAILNLTPDSFSGDGIMDCAPAVARVRRARADGADILDVGGESTRPGATPVPEEEEMARLLPTVEAIAGSIDLPISVDTRKASVADAVLARGVDVINDVSGLADADMAPVVARAGAGLVLVHGDSIDPGSDPLAAVRHGLEHLVDIALRCGLDAGKLMLDPGLGFGKTWRTNLEIVLRLRELRVLGLPLLVGPSRKGTIGKVLGLPVEERLEGTAALVTACIAGGADIIRVHDVRSMTRIARMTDALARP